MILALADGSRQPSLHAPEESFASALRSPREVGLQRLGMQGNMMSGVSERGVLLIIKETPISNTGSLSGLSVTRDD